MALKVANFNGCKVYNLTADKVAPAFLSEAKKRALRKDENYRARLELIQDFEMTTATQCIKMSSDREHCIITGGYPPIVKCYTLSDMSMKFQRGLSSEVVAFECLSSDYGKMVFLQEDRTLAFHAPYGTHYNIRVPKFGRDLAYGWENCDLYVAASGDEMYRLNLEGGQFKEPLKLGFTGCNKVRINSKHRLLAAGGEGGIVELWDTRAKNSAASINVANANASSHEGNADITALTWDTDGLTLGVGTSTGNCLLYDIRSSVPIHEKEHQYGLPVIDVAFHGSGSSRHVLSTDKKIVKIWERDEPNCGKVLTNIETDADINAVHVVEDKRGQSGLIMVAGEQSRIMTYFVPQLGPAPRWCSYLESLTEELEENNGKESTVYEDYKFVTKSELIELGATALIGTPMLKGYMHGYFMEMKLYSKLRAVSKPFEYEEHRKKKIRDKIDEKRASRIIAQKRAPKVNKELAEKMQKSALRNKKLSAASNDNDGDNDDDGDTDKNGVDLVDTRFSALFKREEFQQDIESYDYKLRNPTLGTKKFAQHEGDSEDDLQGMYDAVDEDDDDQGGNDSDSYYDEDEDMGADYDNDGPDSDSDLEIRNIDDEDNANNKKEFKKKVKVNAKSLAKEMKKRKHEYNESDDEDGAILSASRKIASKSKKQPKFFEISDTYNGNKVGMLAGMNDKETKLARKNEKMKGTVPISNRLQEENKKSRSTTNTVNSRSSGFVKELSYVPKDKKENGNGKTKSKPRNV
jgi:ribosome biogenesis protein ENP2